MGSYLSFRLIYGVCPTGDSERLWDHEETDGEFESAIAMKRGATPVDWSTYRDVPYLPGEGFERHRVRERAAYDEWKALPEVKAQREAWDAAIAQVRADYPNLEQDIGGVTEFWSVDVLGIKDSGFTAHGGVTALEGILPDAPFFPDKRQWDEELNRALEELGAPADEVTGPTWIAVISYG